MKGKSEIVVKHILSNPMDIKQLMECLEEDNEALRMRCCDAMEKLSRLHPDWFKPYKLMLLKTAKTLTQKEVRWHMAQIIPRLELTNKQIYAAYETFSVYLNDKSSIVKTFAMQALTDLALKEPTLFNETRELIQKLGSNGTPAMRSRSKQLLKVLT